MTATTFGPEWSRALCLGCASLDVPPDWVLAVLALEGGFNPLARNASGARGMWQRMPDPVYSNGKPLVLGNGEPAPPGCIVRSVKDKITGVVTGQSVHRLYAPTDPVQQINDFFAWTRSRLHVVNSGKLKSRSALYCCNLAPERLRDGRYTDETILYSAPSEAYKQNAAPFGLDAKDPHGALRMKHLAYGLDAAVARHRTRYNAELAAAHIANVTPPPDAA